MGGNGRKTGRGHAGMEMKYVETCGSVCNFCHNTGL